MPEFTAEHSSDNRISGGSGARIALGLITLDIAQEIYENNMNSIIAIPLVVGGFALIAAGMKKLIGPNSEI